MAQSTRQSLTLMSSTFDAITMLSEGNVGAMTLLMHMLGDDPLDGMMDLLTIDDLNMRGEQIYVASKQYPDIEAFRDALRKRDQGMIDAVNAACPREPGERVFTGASFKRRR